MADDPQIAAGGGVRVVTVPELEDLEVASATKVSPAPDATAAPPAAEASGGIFGSWQRTAAVVAAGTGVVGLGVGTLFGLQAKSNLDDSNANGHCRPDNRCDATGTASRNQALTSATMSTVAFVAGGALIAGGVVLYLVAPTSPAQAEPPPAAARAARPFAVARVEVRPQLGPTEQGLLLRVDF